MKDLEKVLTEQSLKSVAFISKEIDHLFSTEEKPNEYTTFWFNAVFNDFKIPFDYIGYKNKKNRDNLKGICSCISALKILQNISPNSIEIMFKDTLVKTIKVGKIYSFSIKYNSENNYIVKYSIGKGKKDGI